MRLALSPSGFWFLLAFTLGVAGWWAVVPLGLALVTVWTPGGRHVSHA